MGAPSRTPRRSSALGAWRPPWPGRGSAAVIGSRCSCGTRASCSRPTSRAAPTVSLVTLGCPKNQVDSEVMLGELSKAGLRVIDEPSRADVVIVNTCGFIDTAKEESINTIIELGEFKKSGACRTLIATGCLTQRYQGELLKELPELDAIVGTGDFPRIVEIVQSRMDAHADTPRLWFEHPTFLYDAATPRRRIGPRHWAYVKISEGCDKRCAFCAIPR